ncbi:MAG: hypothetical protein M1441_02110 [Candidatus Parvarchaeota archaeon]|jgi:hypothetical protein|nr:hypothetical protein [Candidatus Parvarchaeota archaeon]
MVIKDKIGYKCEICLLHYRDEVDAKACEDWDRAHEACNLEIARRSLEASKEA